MRGYIQIIITGALSCLSLKIGPEGRASVSLVGCELLVNEPCNTDLVQFTLFNSSVGKFLDATSPDAGDWFDPFLPAKVLIHGYNEADQAQSGMQLVKKAYLAKGDYNIIYVEWWKLSLALCYPEAVVNIQHVGYCVSELLYGLERNYQGFALENVHAVGFSLGAHVAQFASNIMSTFRGVKFTRITGLDPAKPLIEGSRKWRHLDATDAHFVDIVHTNAGLFGWMTPLGHVDFYVNGGRYQRNCNDSFSFNSKGCSHGRAAVYFAESVNSEVGFWGIPCQSLFHAVSGTCRQKKKHRMIMGDPCPTEARGLYYVHTNMGPPYAVDVPKPTVRGSTYTHSLS